MPSLYIPRPPSARTRRIDDGLAALIDSSPLRPLSQKEIGERCGISKQAVAKIEKRARRKLVFGLRRIGIERSFFKDPDYTAVMKAG